MKNILKHTVRGRITLNVLFESLSFTLITFCSLSFIYFYNDKT